MLEAEVGLVAEAMRSFGFAGHDYVYEDLVSCDTSPVEQKRGVGAGEGRRGEMRTFNADSEVAIFIITRFCDGKVSKSLKGFRRFYRWFYRRKERCQRTARLRSIGCGFRCQ